MSYRVTFEKIKLLGAVQRGNAFEKLMNKILEDSGILVSARYRTVDRQQEIDGAILVYNKVFLVETKWEKTETLAASKLYSFLGKINSKIDGTLGIFISFNELKPNFIDSVRNGLRQNCILIHGPKNIYDIIDKKVELKEYLEYCFIQASTKNKVAIDTSTFISIPKIGIPQIAVANNIIENWKELYDSLTGNDSLADFSAKLEGYYSGELELSKKILSLYDTFNFDSSLRDKFNKVVEKLIREEKTTFTNELIERFKSNNWFVYADELFCEKLRSCGLTIPITDRESIIANVIQVLNGDWEQENKASFVITIFYDNLTIDEKIMLAKQYLEIYCDRSRLEKFQQKKLANRLFDDLKNPETPLFRIVETELIENARSSKLEESIYLDDEPNIEIRKKFTVRILVERYHKIFLDFNINPQLYFEEIYDQI